MLWIVFKGLSSLQNIITLLNTNGSKGKEWFLHEAQESEVTCDGVKEAAWIQAPVGLTSQPMSVTDWSMASPSAFLESSSVEGQICFDAYMCGVL